MSYVGPTPLPPAAGGTGGNTFTANSLLVGNGTSAISNSGALTDGQVVIGSTTGAPIAASLTAGTGITITPGHNSITVASTSDVNQQQIFYVAKSGNDLNSGLNIDNAFLTFGAAITAASAAMPSPTNRFAIVCFDDGIYAESFALLSFIDIDAPNATLGDGVTGGSITVNDNTNVKFYTLNVLDATFGITKPMGGTTYSNVHIDIINVAGAGVGAVSLGGELNVSWEQMYLVDGIGIGDITSALAEMHIHGKDIYISGVTGNAIAVGRANAGSTKGQIDHIEEISGGVGTAVFALEGTMDLSIGQISATNAINIDGIAGACTLNLFCNEISGTRSVTNGAVLNIWVPPVAMTNGQLLIGNTTTGFPTVTTLTPGTGIAITNAAGSITIAATGGGGGTPTAFSATPSSPLVDITGDGTYVLPVICDTVNFDTASIYNSTTGIATIATAGYYYIGFNGSVTNSGTINQTVIGVNIVVNGSGLTTWGSNPVGQADPSNGTFIFNCGRLLQLGVGDTVKIGFVAYNGGKTIGLYSVNTIFYGFQVQSSGGGSTFTWNEILGTSTNMTKNNGYIANNAGLVTLTLPAVAAQGDIVEVVGKGAGGWSVITAAGQTIYMNNIASTTGVGGYLNSTAQYNSARFVCTTANVDFTVIASEGTLTIN